MFLMTSHLYIEFDTCAGGNREESLSWFVKEPVDYLQVLSARQESFYFRPRTVQLLDFEAYVYLLYKF